MHASSETVTSVARVLALSVPLLLGCTKRGDPPGSGLDAGKRQVAIESSVRAGLTALDAGAARSLVTRGTTDDNLPFSPSGLRGASTAWRTWIYTDVGPRRTRFGYLRVGSIVDLRGPPIVNEGCAEGWYRINPRGFICIGKGATLDLETPIVRQASVRPVRGAGLPYLYALASDSPPHFYFELPTRKQAARVEGADPLGRFLRWRGREVDSHPEVAELLGTPGPPPDFLANHGRIDKPYGVKHRLEYAMHAGRAAADSGFAISRVMAWDERWFGMTTEHDLIALDRVHIVVPSRFHGIEVPPDPGLQPGFVTAPATVRFALDPKTSAYLPRGALSRREPVLLTGQRRPGGMWELRDGDWVAASALLIIPSRSDYPSFATGNRKWIELSIRHQTLVAYVGRRPVYATLVSTGRGGLGDPETESATPRGTFMIYAKHVTATMDGADDVADSYSLLDVPFVQYFHKGFALHGTYWHDEFGRLRSHGCVNLAPVDAAWLFEWTDPQVPAHWHGVLNKQRGTVVYIHA